MANPFADSDSDAFDSFSEDEELKITALNGIFSTQTLDTERIQHHWAIRRIVEFSIVDSGLLFELQPRSATSLLLTGDLCSASIQTSLPSVGIQTDRHTTADAAMNCPIVFDTVDDPRGRKLQKFLNCAVPMILEEMAFSPKKIGNRLKLQPQSSAWSFSAQKQKTKASLLGDNAYIALKKSRTIISPFDRGVRMQCEGHIVTATCNDETAIAIGAEEHIYLFDRLRTASITQTRSHKTGSEYLRPVCMIVESTALARWVPIGTSGQTVLVSVRPSGEIVLRTKVSPLHTSSPVCPFPSASWALTSLPIGQHRLSACVGQPVSFLSDNIILYQNAIARIHVSDDCILSIELHYLPQLARPAICGTVIGNGDVISLSRLGIGVRLLKNGHMNSFEITRNIITGCSPCNSDNHFIVGSAQQLFILTSDNLNIEAISESYTPFSSIRRVSLTDIVLLHFDGTTTRVHISVPS